MADVSPSPPIQTFTKYVFIIYFIIYCHLEFVLLIAPQILIITIIYQNFKESAIRKYYILFLFFRFE